jgi:hypothetical protein
MKHVPNYPHSFIYGLWQPSRITPAQARPGSCAPSAFWRSGWPLAFPLVSRGFHRFGYSVGVTP